MIIVDPANNTADKPEGRKTLTLLVRRYKEYTNNLPLYPDFTGTLLAAVADPTEGPVNVKALNAILAQLLTFPMLVADSEGSQDERIYFSIGGNWDELAQTVLDTLYEPAPTPFVGAFVVAERGLPRDCEEVRYIFADGRRFR